MNARRATSRPATGTSTNPRQLSGVAAVSIGLLLVPAMGCEETAEERRDAYCEQVKTDSADLTRISDEGGAGAFLKALPILEDLQEKSPSDLKDEWKVFIDALNRLEDVVEETGIDPARIEDRRLPTDISRPDRRRLRAAASGLQSVQVKESVRGIEQQAIDVCGQPLI